MLACLAFAIALPGARLPSARVDVIFVKDVSNSVQRAAPLAADTWIAQALKSRGGDDQVAEVDFDGDTRLASPLSSGGLATVAATNAPPGSGGTNIARALQVAQGLVPPGNTGKIILLSDGQENAGDSIRQAHQVEAGGVEVNVVPIGGHPPEVAAVALSLPGNARTNELFSVRLTVQSNLDSIAGLQLYVDGQLADEETAPVRTGTNNFSLRAGPLAAGHHMLRAVIQPAHDTVSDNNVIETELQVLGAPHILLVGSADDSRLLANALRTNRNDVDIQTPVQADLSALGLHAYDAVVLSNVPAAALSDQQIAGLHAYVRDLGGALIVTGGDAAFGAGGYAQSHLDDLLPVSSLNRARRVTPQVALDIVVDRSGSMTGPKVDAAKQAADRAVSQLQPGDEIGILEFDYEPTWVVPRMSLQSPADSDSVKEAVAGIAARGSTDMYPAMAAAYHDMTGSSAAIKHIVLLTDGDSTTSGDYNALVAAMQHDGITLSTIAIGDDADTNLLGALASSGGGRSFVASDAEQVPALLFEDTRLVAPPALKEGAVTGVLTPAGRAQGLAPLSQAVHLSGYDTSTGKPNSSVEMATESGDPLLAQWQVGLGRVTAWTSDLGTRWTAAWGAQPQFGAFWNQVVRDTLPGLIEGDLHTTVMNQNGSVTVTVDALTPGGQFVNGADIRGSLLARDGRTSTFALVQSAPGEYQAQVSPGPDGASLLSVTQLRDGAVVAEQTTTIALGVPAELVAIGANEANLRNIAAAGGGAVLVSPSDAFRRDAFSSISVTLWQPLVVLGMLLLLFELAIRHLGLFFLCRRAAETPAIDVIVVMRALDEKRRRMGGQKATRDVMISDDTMRPQ